MSRYQAIEEVLGRLGVEARIREMPASTRTAQEAARAVGCSIAQIAKSLVFRGMNSQQAILVVASGANRVQEKKVGAEIGDNLGKADADFVREQTGFAIGGVPPFGHRRKLLTLLDEDLFLHEEIWAAAGTPFSVFPLTPAQLLAATSGRRISIK